MTKLPKDIEKRIRKDLRKAYDLAASTDDRSDVECLIDACIYELERQKEEIIEELKKQHIYLSQEAFYHKDGTEDFRAINLIDIDQAIKTIKGI